MPSLFFSHPTLSAFKKHLIREYESAVRDRYEGAGANTSPIVTEPARKVTRGEANVASPELPVRDEVVAVVGMSGVFPGSPTLDDFWRHLEKGDDLIREVPADRASWREIGQSGPATKKPTRWGGFIDGVDAFDAAFFGIPAIEAERMDPQHRLFLQETWRAIESAGESPAALSGRRVGVFAGVQFRDYEGMLARQGIADAYTATGNGHALLANRVSFLLNLRGPSEAVDTACSSSLVALNRAVVALLDGECDAAVAGGVSLLLTPETSIGAGHLSLLAPDGRCKTFDASANGYVKGEGVGVLYLMRLSDALAGGYPVRGIVRGSAVNHGGRAQSLTAPNGQAQRDLLIEVYTRARVAPETVGMIEVHGTGTELGDPVEVTGLKEAFAALAAHFGSPPAGEPSCGLASVKSNIGHLEPAAGIAGVIKVLLAMRHRLLPPTLHVRKLNPYIDLTGTRFYVLTQARPWAAIQSREGRELPRRAGVSSFGFGGANAHVILEEFRGPKPAPALPGPRIIVLSAKTKTALARKVADLREWLEDRAEPDDLAALSYTLALGRSHFNERAALVADSVSDLRRKLDQLAQGQTSGEVWRGVAARVKESEQLEWEAKLRMLPDTLEALRATARGYVAGYEPDWARLFEPAARQRLESPGYPLAQDRFWISSTPASPVARRPDGAELPPLFDRVEMTSARCRFHKTIRADEFYVQDHVVNGVKTVPGVAYLEWARAAAAAWGGLGEVAALRHVVWAQPILVQERSTTIIIELVRKESGDVAFEVRTDAPTRPILHAQGKIGFSAPTPIPPERFALEAFEKTCALRLDQEQIYRAFERIGLSYGPSFRVLDWLKAGPAGAVGRLRLPPVVAAAPDRSRQIIHPSLMDAVLQTVLGLHALEPNREAVLSVPFGIDEVVILAPLPETCLAVCSPPTRSHSQAPQKHDFQIYSEAGELVCAIHGFMTRELPAPAAPSVASGNRTRFYLPSWTPASVPERATPNAGAVVLVLDDDNARFATVRERIHASSPGVRVVQVRAGAAFRADGEGAIAMRPGATDDGVRLVKSVLGEGSRNLYLLQLWPLATPADAGVSEWPGGLRTGVFAAFSLAQALQKCGVHSVQWVHACREDGAAAAGFFKCLSQENGRYRGRVVEIDNVSGGTLADRLLDELFAVDLAQEVRWDGSGRFVKTLLPFTPATKANPPAQPPVYLITGGLGELGRRVAEHLARSTTARLVLLGRSPLSADGESFLEQLQVWGGEGMYVQADVSVSPEVEQAVRMALERFGCLDGVIHAAGVIRDAFVLKKTLEDFAAVLRVKVLGAVNLDRATQALPLQHFVLFSSVSSVLGNLGQADYAAANGFLDSFARRRETRRSAGERQGKTVSINWPIWSEGGMSVDAQTERWLQNRLGMRPLPTSAGLDALDAAMASPQPQCVVLYGDPMKLDQALLGSTAKATAPPAEASGVPAGSGADRQAMSSTLTGIFAEILRVPPSDIDVDATFDDFGVDSIMMITIMNELEKRLSRTLPPSVLADHPTVSALAGYLADSAPAPAVAVPRGTQVLNGLATTGGEGSVSVCSVPQDRRIAVVGMSCRFPQSPALQAYWENLEAGRDLVRELPDWRWDVAASFSVDKRAPLKSYVKSGGIVDGIDLFDAAYFGISDRDALGLDPQHRLLLELARELFDHAGYPDAEIRGRRVGVIIGATEGRYLLSNLKHLTAEQTGHMVVNTGQNMMAARIADFFDLRGPAKTVDTACSSSMMAVHDACQALLSGDIEMAVAGGVHLLVDESDFVGFSKARVLSEDGCCRVFDERANGFVLGEGAGLVLMRPYQAAVAAKDRILATILASAANNDGHTPGLTVPSLEGQREVMETALARSGVDPATVSYLEAHGTGTLLGDPIEIKAAASVYGRGGARLQHCAVASVKSNMGHLMHAAGIASLIKLVLSLQRGVKPPTLHCLKPHPRFRFAESPFYPIIRAEPWETGDGPRRGAVSSFGFGGTNVHAILQEHPAAGGERRPLPPTRFQRRRYWLGREIVAVGPEPAGFDHDRAVALLRRLKSGAISRGDVLKELQL
ncbi:MAG: SDR family NAD(P)-dependent oxidoreductase [Verrucomicrobia bacterium]|nr:SDR family NAD(P)-dependent oxidoreductase [Verrucomicrobiota bacterium]